MPDGATIIERNLAHSYRERAIERARFAVERHTMKRVMAHPMSEDEYIDDLTRQLGTSFEPFGTAMRRLSRDLTDALVPRQPHGPFMACKVDG